MSMSPIELQAIINILLAIAGIVLSRRLTALERKLKVGPKVTA